MAKYRPPSLLSAQEIQTNTLKDFEERSVKMKLTLLAILVTVALWAVPARGVEDACTGGCQGVLDGCVHVATITDCSRENGSCNSNYDTDIHNCYQDYDNCYVGCFVGTTHGKIPLKPPGR
jgi:hypothetical protein